MSRSPSPETALRHRRRLTMACVGRQNSHINTRSQCRPLPESLEALDLSSSSLTPALASLRLLVLSYLADLEARLSQFESPLSDVDSRLDGATEKLKSKGEYKVEEARAWAEQGLEMLEAIRADVSSYLPDFSFDLDNLSGESMVKGRQQVASYLDDVYSHLPDMPHLPDLDSTLTDIYACLDEVRSRLPDMPNVRSRLPDFDLSDMRSRLHDLDLNSYRPLSYALTLSQRLESLQSHLSSLPRPPMRARAFSELIDKVSSDVIPHLLEKGKERMHEGEERLEHAAKEIGDAIKRSFNGSQLITYMDLPQQWRNNQFVNGGYRFIPIERWPLIILSLFALHNETLNIHTHLIPLVLWFPSLLSSLLPTLPALASTQMQMDVPELTFTAFALFCLFCSALWHTMSGCAHPKGMEICARVDYVGIGWLISASVGTVVYYGFRCHPSVTTGFLCLSFVMGVVGSILPFMQWFNERKHKNWRIAFFLALAFTAVAPLTYLSYLYSTAAMFTFISPVMRSITSYLIGLTFYATHFPECFFARSSRLSGQWLDWIGGGSHAIWHVFIVIAIWQHRQAMSVLKYGIGDQMCHAALR